MTTLRAKPGHFEIGTPPGAPPSDYGRRDLGRDLHWRPKPARVVAHPRPASGGPPAAAGGLCGERLIESAFGFQSPFLPPWGSERLFAEGRIILKGAAPAATGVNGAASACAVAELGSDTSTGPTDATVTSIVVPANKVAVVIGYFARPESALGWDAGQVTFNLDNAGQRTQLPQRLLGLRGSFAQPIPCFYVARSGTTMSLLATNASTQNYHCVTGILDYYLMTREAYRRFAGRGCCDV